MPDVLLLDSHSRQGLAAVRSLGRQGLAVTAASHWQWNPGRLSRHADRFVRTPNPETAPRQFLASIESAVRARPYDVVLPTSEPTVDLVVQDRARIERHAYLPFPDTETIEVGLDKGRTIEVARRLDVPHPTTMLPDEVAFDAVASELGYPVVVKPQRGSGRDGVAVCDSRHELESVYRETTAEYGPTQLQEFVPNGGERGVYAIYDESSTLAGVTVQQRIRSKPPEGGASTVRETVHDSELIALADRLLTAIGWEGVAMAEFRVDPGSGRPKLLEINPRLWGSLSLSIAAGVDFPALLYRLAVDGSIPDDLTYDCGVRGRCLFTDLLQVREREDTLAATVEFLVPSRKPTTYDVVSLDDPLPALGQLLLMGTAVKDDVAPEEERRTLLDTLT